MGRFIRSILLAIVVLALLGLGVWIIHNLWPEIAGILRAIVQAIVTVLIAIVLAAIAFALAWRLIIALFRQRPFLTLLGMLLIAAIVGLYMTNNLTP
jgi:hypothetical protein